MTPIEIALLVLLILLLVGVWPSWGYSSSWGYMPSGLVAALLLLLLFLILSGVVAT